jgi:outer membrane autotransporter protein
VDLSIFSDFEVLEVVEAGPWTFAGSGNFPEGITVMQDPREEVQTLVALDETVNLSGNYVQGENTSLYVRVNPDGTNDRLVVDGDATIEENTLLQLAPSGQLVDDQTYEFLTTTGTLTGLFEELNFPDDTGVLRFSQVATANSLAVEFSRFSYTSAAATSNQTATAIHLDEILAAGATGDMEAVLASLDTLSGAELQAALDALHPEAYDAQASAVLSFGGTVTQLAAFRRPRCEDVVYERRPEIAAPSPCSRSWMPWGSAFGLFAKRNGKSGHIDFDHAGGGLLLGADHPLGQHFLVYGFLGGGYTSVDVDAVGDGNLISATLGAGGRWSLGGTRVDGLVGYARGWHEQERRIDFGEGITQVSRTAKADYGSNLIMAFVKAGHTFRFGSLDLEPLATLEYGYLMEESFRESGAGDLDLELDKRSNSVLSTTLGARLAYTLFKWEYLGEFLEWADGIWTPELSARWRGNWIGMERDLDARMLGAPVGVSDFTVSGREAKQGVQVGAGVAFQPLRLLMSFRLDYDGFYGDGSMIHRIGASIRVPLGFGGSAS